MRSHWRLHETSCTENEKCACAQRNCTHPEQLVAYMCVYRLQQLTNEVNNSETATDCVHDVVCQLENIYMSHMFLSKLYCSTVLAYKLYMGKLYMSNITKHVPLDVNTLPQRIQPQTNISTHLISNNMLLSLFPVLKLCCVHLLY